ncbi:hypothetical protein SKAU_G00022830 [Synaphobranchus kaupii]|uniref:CCHC-type domain-containing protein n=1 Tax=Synaphobranchus kaupii TaxID=118154 RepID=A0A9Q1GDG9_SYNKA|nr:hypothetical protein SKAU_G00022830 [Synaphobranchus kaupii]
MPCSGFSLPLNLIQPPTNHLILRDLHPLQINISLTELGNPRCQPHPDNRIRDRNRDQALSRESAAPPTTPNVSPPMPSSAQSEEPMQLGRTRLFREERDRRMQEGRCLYCGKTGHFRSHCPELLGKKQSRQGMGRP